MADAKTFKQDMVVSIRYRNDLPPPPMPPKLLDIDTGGLAQYLTTSYASGLAKREEPNIEADAEGGMPIDMIGVPGYFLGDESAIMAPEIAPALDPADQALMMSLEQLKTQGAKNNVSFLRKTQYMHASGQAAKTTEPFMRPSPRAQQTPGAKAPPPPVPVSRDDPGNIKRQIQKGFDIAHPDSISSNPKEARANTITSTERSAWDFPKHPENHRLTPLEIYPIFPDLETGTDMASNWQALKFDKPPLPALKNGRRDERIDVGLLMASENPESMPEWKAKKEAHNSDPVNFPDPGPEPYAWSLSVPKQVDSTPRIRQLFDESNASKDDASLMKPLLEESADGSLRLPFERVRVYTDATRSEVDPRRVVALSLVKPTNLPQHSRFRKRGTAAYYYPIYERVKMKADRGQLTKKARTRLGAGPEVEEQLPDQMMVLFREPDAKEKHIRSEFRGRNDRSFAQEWEELTREAQKQEDSEQAELQREQGGDEGNGDVSMAEGDAEEATNGVERRDPGDEGSSPLPVNGLRDGNAGGDADAAAEAEADEDMRDE